MTEVRGEVAAILAGHRDLQPAVWGLFCRCLEPEPADRLDAARAAGLLRGLGS
ncbi:MAG: hypothetical protein QNK37_30320 [Acidobacteriota bacterium]|nr:hypothetical protein [Acidobacteriota bacterium]